MRIPISIKLIVMTIIQLVMVTVPIAWIISSYFEQTARQREENINLDYAAAHATQVEDILDSVVDKTRTLSLILMKSNQTNDFTEFNREFEHDKNFLTLEIQNVDGATVAQNTKTNVIHDLCKCDPAILTSVRSWQAFPFDSVRRGQVEVQNATYPKGPSMFTIGIPLLKDADGKITHMAIADLDLGTLQKPFSEMSERTFLALDRRGIILAHSDEARTLAREDFSKSEVFKALDQSSSLPRGQKQIKDDVTGESLYSAYARTNFGVTVISQIPEQIILEPAHQIKRKVFFVGGIVLSCAIFMVFIFSMTLTSPLEKLVKLLELVTGGNFDVTASDKIKSIFRDEVVEIASAFDHMTAGLRERDKVKMLFTKFHGSSVTDDLLKRQIGLGGQRKDVVVFFSDIRGFTKMSEMLGPEVVVELLNEYFAEMVAIITAHGGIVDKFIGDAIMAIWGAPNSSKDDTRNAVRACLEMRRRLAELNARRIAHNKEPIAIGMGLHTGPAISGPIGSNERMEYTVIGSTVNTTSRIESATKVIGADLLVSQAICEQVKGEFAFDSAGKIEFKGRAEPLGVFRVKGYYEANGSQFVEVHTKYTEYEPESSEKMKIRLKEDDTAA